MCAQFMIQASIRKLEAHYEIEVSRATTWRPRILPYGLAPIVLLENGKRTLDSMRFSLLPAWSKEPRVRFATHNARLDGVAEKPTWKRVFARQRCLVPLTNFIEPIYQGQHAGYMVDFHDPQREILSAAGLWDEWRAPEGDQVIRSFAILTDDPLPFVRETGHDRSPVFLDASAHAEWLREGVRESAELLGVLRHRARLRLVAENDRALKPGWERQA